MRHVSMWLPMKFTLLAVVFAHSAYAGQPDNTPPADADMKPSKGPSAPEALSLSGTIAETMNSGGYTYLRIEKDGLNTWAAIPETKLTVGEHITLPPGHEMVNFTSATLNRTFETIIFTTGPTSAQSAHDTSDKMSAHGGAMGSKGVATSTTEAIKVDKATGPNTYTVAEIFEKRSELDKKPVTVSGKVVKVSAGIMGKNWLHIQDGSGNAKDGNNDLVVTTQDIPKVGDIVTANGTLSKDKDLGSGYKYDALIEDAILKK